MNNYWIISFDGDWVDTNSLSLKLGAPTSFTPSALVDMPKVVGQAGARDVLIWRLRHWGFSEPATRVRWRRMANGSYTVKATGGNGAPTELVKMLGKTYKNVRFSLVWLSSHGFQGGEVWHQGQATPIPIAVQDRILFEEFSLTPQ